MKAKPTSGLRAGTVALIMLLALGTANAADKYGIFELIHRSSLSFEETRTSVEAALKGSALTVHVVHEVRVPDQKQQASVIVVTSPAYLEAAAGESVRTISAQILRVAVYTWGEEQQTLVNMTNPEAHAMVFYAESDNYDAMLEAARRAADEIRAALSEIPGEAVSIQQSPMRTEKHYRKFKGDGPARMMTKFRRYQKSQRPISETTADDFQKTVDAIAATLDSSEISDSSEATGWQRLVQIPVGDDAVLFGISNPYIEDKMIAINSRFRSDGKTDETPYPGVDHVAALPTELLVVKEDGETRVLQYGQMWRMQLYFWDSGYRAFTANVGVPSAIFDSIEDLLAED
jgi:uncharacterized protein (DUF302 family)